MMGVLIISNLTFSQHIQITSVSQPVPLHECIYIMLPFLCPTSYHNVLPSHESLSSDTFIRISEAMMMLKFMSS